MQPQTPASPTPEYDFIMKDAQPPKKGLSLPTAGLPKPALMALGAVIGLLLLILVIGLFSKGNSGGSNLQYEAVLARAQEIERVSGNVGTLATDSLTQDLSATTQTTLTSQQSQLTSYLTTSGIKFTAPELASDMDSATDTEMQTASTNSDLAAVYDGYLKSELTLYASDLQVAYKIAGPNGKSILSADYTSTQTLLSDPSIVAAN